ncbi:sec-independent translocase [Kitasatospora sp. NPDC003701]
MFSDVGGLEILTLVIMAIVIFGPDKLPKLIQDTMGFIKKVRSFADTAKEDIRSELGPEFKDFEFEDLHPKTFVRKQLMGGQEDPLGLKEIRDSLDIRSVLDDKPAVAVNGHGRTGTVSMDKSGAAGATGAASSGPALQPGERPPFDPDAT